MKSLPYKYLTLTILLVFTGSSNLWSQSELKIVDKTVSFGMREASNRTIDVIIIHSTFNNSGGEKYDIDLVIKQFSRYGVSSHYVIGRDGTVYQLVKEQNISYHAGKSILPDGRTAVNSCSVGIEIMTSFDESPSEEQVKALTMLVNDIKTKHAIRFILRHSDIAPERKTDPWNMDWDAFIKMLNE